MLLVSVLDQCRSVWMLPLVGNSKPPLAAAIIRDESSLRVLRELRGEDGFISSP